VVVVRFECLLDLGELEVPTPQPLGVFAEEVGAQQVVPLASADLA